MIIKDLTHQEYLDADGLSNSELLMVGRSPADYIWNKNAPSDPAKVQTRDFGTALHMSVLEPERFDDDVLVTSIKTRTSKGFQDLIVERPDQTILTEIEAEQMRIMQASAMAHPVFSQIVNDADLKEVSIFTRENGIDLKIRPDIDLVEKYGFLADVKTTAKLEDWRSTKSWANPLLIHNYGHTAAFYLYVASLHYGFDVNVYKFMVIQKSVCMGRYPVSVFTVDRDYLVANGFWDQMVENLAVYSRCLKENKWDFDEYLPMFVQDEDIQITFEGGE